MIRSSWIRRNASSGSQRAWETKELGGGHGVFFHFVLEGLRGKPKNNRGEVTWLRLVVWLILGLVIYFAYGLKLRRLNLPPAAPESKQAARRLLRASVIYLPLLFGLMMLSAAWHF